MQGECDGAEDLRSTPEARRIRRQGKNLEPTLSGSTSSINMHTTSSPTSSLRISGMCMILRFVKNAAS